MPSIEKTSEIHVDNKGNRTEVNKWGKYSLRLTSAADVSVVNCEGALRPTLGWYKWLGDKPNGLTW